MGYIVISDDTVPFVADMFDVNNIYVDNKQKLFYAGFF
jgi:hypothetical protein